MPRRKAAARGPQPVQSDYDTDTAGNITDSAALAPPPARTNTELNLAVLQRYSPNVSRIVAIAPFAVVYLFSPETQLWEKCGIEGTLFVCQLAGQHHPQYQVIILNRRSLDNFITELKSGEDVEITDEYVILQVSGDEGLPKIYGLWIYSDNEAVPSTKEVVAMSIQECAVRAEYSHHTSEHNASLAEGLDYESDTHAGTDGTAEAGPYASHTSLSGLPDQQVDLLSMLRKPQTKHDLNVPDRSPAMNPYGYVPNPEFASMLGPSAVMHHGMMPTSEPARAQSTQQQHALLNLFNSASQR